MPQIQVKDKKWSHGFKESHPPTKLRKIKALGVDILIVDNNIYY